MTCHASKQKQDKLSHSYLTQILDYNSETGEFTWKISPSSRVRIGDIAGKWQHDGYRVIVIRKEYYMAHRLAWFYATGDWPEHQIDHINRDKGDNRFSNLRDVTPKENVSNKTDEGKAASLRQLELGRLSSFGMAMLKREGGASYLCCNSSRNQLHGTCSRLEQPDN